MAYDVFAGIVAVAHNVLQDHDQAKRQPCLGQQSAAKLAKAAAYSTMIGSPGADTNAICH